MITVGKAASMFGISRTALLYYDSLGLISAKRAENGYRLYSEEDIERLRRIITLRGAGVPLNEISAYLGAPGTNISSILLKRLSDINSEIDKYRKQQTIIIKLLGDADLKQTRKFKTEEWMDILRRAGVEENAKLAWHINFEKQSPAQHHELLRALGFSREEIARFRSVYEANSRECAADDESSTL